MKYASLLMRLEDDRLYLAATIAEIHCSPETDYDVYVRARMGLSRFTRFHKFPVKGDGQITRNHRGYPAWYGKRWKEALSEANRLGMEPMRKRDRRTHTKARGRKLAYPEFIVGLDSFTLYNGELALRAGLSRGLKVPQAKEPTQLARTKVLRSLNKYVETYLPEEPDGTAPLDARQLVEAWWGWRWLLSAPDYVVSKADKEDLRVRVDLWKTVPRLGRFVNGRAARLFNTLLSPRKVLRSLAVVMMIVMGYFAFHLWFPWPRSLEERARLRVEHPTPEGLTWFVREYREAEPESYVRDSLLPAILRTAGGLQTDESIYMLREVLKEEPEYPERLVALIAEINQSLGQVPVFLGDAPRPIFSAAIRGNPIIVFREGTLRPGDWANVQSRTGYISRIETNSFVMRVGEQTTLVNFPPLEVMGAIIPNLGRITCWPGSWNMVHIMEALCIAKGWNLFDMGGYPGHIGGTFDADTFERFLEICGENLAVELRADDLVVSNVRKIRTHIESAHLIFYDFTVQLNLDFFAKQLGLTIDSSKINQQLLEKKVTIVDVQFSEFLDALELTAELDPTFDKIVLK